MDSADVLLIGDSKKLRLKPIKTSRNYNVTSGVPVSKHFNDSAAQWAYETVMKMDDDEARMFITSVTFETLTDHIRDNKRTVVRKIAEIQDEMAQAAMRINPDLVDVIERVSKAMGDDPYKRDASGRFARTESRIRTSRGYKTMPKSAERKSGIPSAKGLAQAQGTAGRSARLNRQERGAYQQQYLAIADALNHATEIGQDRIQVVLQNKHDGRQSVVNVDGSNFGPGGNKMQWWNPALQDAVAVRHENTGRAATYDLVSALGGSNETAARTAGALQTGGRPVNTFADRWTDASQDQRGSSTAGTYRRIQAGSELLGAVSTSPKAQAAAQFGRYVGEFGPEAEKVIGPSMRKTAYRYRGTEKDPDKELVRRAERLAESAHAKTYTDLPMHRQGVERIKGAPAELKMMQSRSAAIQHLYGKLPDRRLGELHLKSGRIPPSEGVIIDSDGDIVTQAIGYAEDHYLPFNLKNMNKLQGGMYVRTRSTGGITTEDIYAGLVSGARQLTVVSHSGVFTIDFADDFRGLRRYNDKAAAMTERYAKTLDAIKNGQIERIKLDPKDKARIREEVEAEGWSGRELEQQIKQRERDFKSNPFPTTSEIQDIERKVGQAVFSDNSLTDTQKEAEFKRRRAQEISDLVGERQDRFYKLDGEGYSVALEALREQFPYYIDDVSFVNRKNMKLRGQKFDPSGSDQPNELQRSLSGAGDAGYVKARHNRSDDVLDGYYDSTINGTGKMRASETNYQNWEHNPNNRRGRGARQETPQAPEQAEGTPTSARQPQQRTESQEQRRETPVSPTQQARAHQAAVEAERKAVSPAVKQVVSLGEENVTALASAKSWQVISDANNDIESAVSSPARKRELLEALETTEKALNAHAESKPADAPVVAGAVNAISTMREELKAAERASNAAVRFDGPAYRPGAPVETIVQEHNAVARSLAAAIPAARNFKTDDSGEMRKTRKTVDDFIQTAEAEGIASAPSQAIAVEYVRATLGERATDEAVDANVMRIMSSPEELNKELTKAKGASEKLGRLEALAVNLDNASTDWDRGLAGAGERTPKPQQEPVRTSSAQTAPAARLRPVAPEQATSAPKNLGLPDSSTSVAYRQEVGEPIVLRAASVIKDESIKRRVERFISHANYGAAADAIGGYAQSNSGKLSPEVSTQLFTVAGWLGELERDHNKE